MVRYDERVTNDLSRGPPVPSLLDEPSQSLAAVLRAESAGQEPRCLWTSRRVRERTVFQHAGRTALWRVERSE